MSTLLLLLSYDNLGILHDALCILETGPLVSQVVCIDAHESPYYNANSAMYKYGLKN